MNFARMRHVAIPLFTLLAGAALVTVVDGRSVAYAIGASALTISIVYSWLAAKNQFEHFPLIRQIAVAFFVWAGFSAVFAIRTFQLTSLLTITILGVVLSIVAGFLWVEQEEKESGPLWCMLALLLLEWFVIFLFAPAHYMVLGTLTMIAFTATGFLFDMHQENEKITRRIVVRHIIFTLLIAALFIFGFSWVL